jgi:hypothetical protein
MNGVRFESPKPEKRFVFWSVPLSQANAHYGLGDLATANQPFGTDIPFLP